MNALRKELQEMMQIPQTARKPVLRRSLPDDWLYSTDLPAVSDKENQDR